MSDTQVRCRVVSHVEKVLDFGLIMHRSRFMVKDHDHLYLSNYTFWHRDKYLSHRGPRLTQYGYALLGSNKSEIKCNAVKTCITERGWGLGHVSLPLVALPAARFIVTQKVREELLIFILA